MARQVDVRRIHRIAWFVIACWLVARQLPAQQAPGALPTPERLLREAYAKTGSALREADLTDILRMCRQARQSNPSAEVAAYADELAAWAYNRRGEAYAEQAAQLGGQAQAADLERRALADFDAAIALAPDNWKPLHNRGVSRAVARQWQDACEDFTAVLQRKPDHANAWFNRGEVRSELGEHDLAIADYTRVIELKPEDVDAHRRRGQAYFQLRMHREALADLDRAVQLAPQQPAPLLDRGDAYRSLGRWQRAAEDYRQAVALDPRHGRAYQSAAWIMATCPLERYRNAELAVQAAEKALELDGRDDPRYLDTAAAAYANAGQFDKACQTVTEALRRIPAQDAPAPQASAGQADSLRRRLESYRQQQPYREPQPTETAAAGF